MGKKKSTSTTTNTYGYMTPPTNPYFTQADDLINNIDYRTPITQQYGKLRNEIGESGGDFFGPNTSPEVADRVKKGRLFRAMTDYGENYSNATNQENSAKINGKMGLGYATAPQLVQTGGSGIGTQSGGILAGMAQQFAGGAGSALGA